MNRWLKRFLVVAALAAIIVVLRVTVFRPKPVPVTVHQVERGRVEDSVVNSRAGTIKSRLRAQMSPGISGLVTAIPVKKGTPVKRGEVMLRLDDGEVRAQRNLAARSLDAAKAAANQACLAADQTSRDRARAESMAQNNLISEQALEEARTRAETAAAACTATREQVKQAEAAVAAAQAVLDKTVMTAPFDGVVLDVTTEVGEWITPVAPRRADPAGDRRDRSRLALRERAARRGRRRAGAPRACRCASPWTPSADSRSQERSPTSRPSWRRARSRTARCTVEAVFTEGDLPANVLPGLSADVEVILDAHDDVLRIPTYALLGGRPGAGGARRQAGVGRGEDRAAQLGVHRSDRPASIAGDRVVVSLDRPEVKAGAKIRVTSESGK